MKKVLFGIILSFIMIQAVEAFEIDVSKISIHNKSDELLSSLDSNYAIDSKDFENNIIYDERAQELSRKLISITASKKSVSDKVKDVSSLLYISKTNGFETITGSIFVESYFKKVDSYDIKYSYIKNIRTVSFLENDVISFVYIPECIVDGEKKDIILSFWIKVDNEEYKIYYPWISIGDDLEAHFNKIANRESQNNIIGDSYNKIDISNNKVKVSNEDLQKIYNDNKNKVVQITSMSDTGSNSYGSGFFIREGIIVTSWSIFADYLNGGNMIYVNDVNGNVYSINGVVAADTNYGVVVLKLDKEVGTAVKFSSSSDLKTGDYLFTINSKNNIGFSVNYGTFMSLENGKMEDLFAISSSDVGSALFDKDGNVVGFHNNDLINSDLSYGNSTDYLRELQKILSNELFSKVRSTKLDEFKNKYYLNLDDEKSYNNVPTSVWNKYKDLGIIENIDLPLVKGTYKDKIVSLRYKNNISNLIGTMYMISDVMEKLESNGYKLTYSDSIKKIYNNGRIKIVLKEDLNYLIVLIMEA